MAANTDVTPTSAPKRAQRRWYTQRRWLLPIAGVAAITAMTVSSAVTYDDPTKDNVSRAAFEAAGLTWPLTVDAGEIECERGVWPTFKPEGSETRYALNGIAKDVPFFSDLDSIWAPDPNVDGLKVNAGDLTDAALALC